MITAKAEEIPTKTLDKKMNCFGLNNDWDKAITFSIFENNFLNIVF
jgi:hypothetical protein